MMIKTLDNVYINMEDFSGFTIGYPNDFDFTVMAMKEQLKKEGFAKVLFSWLYDTRQYDKCMDGCYMEITKVS